MLLYQKNIIQNKIWPFKKRINDYVLYHGWIYGNKKDEDLLRSFGIEGKMKWKFCANDHLWEKGSFNRETGKTTKEYGPTVLEEYGVSGIFENCIIREDKFERVFDNCKKFYSLFFPETFTGIDEFGKQLPKEKQKYGIIDLKIKHL